MKIRFKLLRLDNNINVIVDKTKKQYLVLHNCDLLIKVIIRNNKYYAIANTNSIIYDLTCLTFNSAKLHVINFIITYLTQALPIYIELRLLEDDDYINALSFLKSHAH